MTTVAPAATELRRRPIRGWVWAGVAALPVALTAAWIGLGHDIRYVLGGMWAAGGSTDVFVHRPLAYRWLLDGLGVVDVGSVGVGEGLVRLVALAFVAGAAWWLRAGLRRSLPSGEASAVAAAVGLAFALAPNGDFLQPEWVAAVLAVAAIGAALTPSTVLLGGLLLAVSVLVGYTTLPTALIAVGVVAVLDRRRALVAAATAVVSGGALFGLSLLAPREWRWLLDGSALNDGVTRDLGQLVEFAANEAMLVPMVALLPASLVVLLRVSRRRVAWLVLVVLAVAVVLGAAFVQGEWFQYHAAALVPLAAGLWALAVARWTLTHGRPPWALVTATVVILFAARVFLGASFDWRSQHGTLAYGTLGGLIVLAGLACAVEPGRDGRQLLSVPVLVGLLALAVPILPTSPYSFDGVDAEYTNAGRVAIEHKFTDELAMVRDRIGADTPVVYLAFGDIAYFLGNPTPCAYPSPAYLRSDLRDTAGYRENLACLSDPSVRYLVLQPSWFDAALPPTVTARFDCTRAITTDDILACPTRP
ncbi:hypothetical protein GCM10027445_38500 [Amycolatopsis endophytica]|uniref:4-amino-4-deoxy-L-arabinose transferase n=1 Tax=Amycolatopsis endophytica TaxID=860233 RepID=A0A853B050_9PSEU|nr:hypothetical protein [Amycolatopsis endophytica]NYI88214.1 hypothetical protein [Amycolatopsis endophytica]